MKSAWSLAKFELKASGRGIFFLILYSLGIVAFLNAMTGEYLNTGFVGLDILFLITFSVAPAWAKPKEFQYQKVNEDLWAAPIFMSLHQLPIPRDVLVKSRFLIYFLYAFPSYVLVLFLFYIDFMNQHMSLGDYLAFSILWISFSILIGGAIPASDGGDKLTTKDMVVYNTVFFTILTVVLIVFMLLYGHGLVYLTMNLAQLSPILTALCSVVIAVGSLFYWMNYARKKIDKVDYL